MTPAVLYVQYTNPASLPPLEHSSRILADAGWRVEFAGVNGVGLEPLTFPPHPRVRVRLLPWARPGWRQKLHYLLFCLWTVWLALRLRPRWVYASDLFACLPGLLLKALGFSVLYHEHDHPGTPGSWFLRVLGACRRQLARRCPCVLPNHARADLFRGETGAPHVTVVWNCPARDEVRADRPSPPGGSEFRAFYVGVVGPTMLPKTVIAALARTPRDVRLVVVGYEVVGAQGYTDELRRYAEELGVADRVRFLGPMPRGHFYQAAAECDVGLVLLPRESPNVNIRHLLGASNKAFDYLACGLALLVTDSPEWRAFAADSTCGLACDPADPESIAAALAWFAGHRAETWRMGECGRRRVAAGWNYEAQFRPVAEFMGATVNAPPEPAPDPLRNADAPAPQLVECGREGPRPVFSICIPQYNRTSFLVAAIRSFAGQQFRNIEICVSDGGSTDGREGEAVEALRASGLPFAYRRSPVNLRYDANTRTAIGLARGRYCILMGNDDALNGPGALAALWEDMEKSAPVGIVISDFCDYRTGERAFRIRETARRGAGPSVAAGHFRNFSFVSGLVLRREPAQALATDHWDGSEMYQTFVGCRMIAAGEPLLERAARLVRKDIVIPGEEVDSYAKRPKVWPCPVVERPMPLAQLGRLVADAIGPHTAAAERRRLNESVLLQLLGITYPYWLFEYRRVQSWPFALGIALGMQPRRTARGVELGFLRRLRVWCLFVVSTTLALTVPGAAFAALKGTLYRFAKSLRRRPALPPFRQNQTMARGGALRGPFFGSPL